MRFTSLAKVLIRGPDGRSVWKEISFNQLPKGGKKLSFRNNSLIVFSLALGVLCYAQFQEEINPDSKWAYYYRRITRDPLAWLMEDKEKLPVSMDHCPPMK